MRDAKCGSTNIWFYIYTHVILKSKSPRSPHVIKKCDRYCKSRRVLSPLHYIYIYIYLFIRPHKPTHQIYVCAVVWLKFSWFYMACAALNIYSYMQSMSLYIAAFLHTWPGTSGLYILVLLVRCTLERLLHLHALNGKRARTHTHHACTLYIKRYIRKPTRII